MDRREDQNARAAELDRLITRLDVNFKLGLRQPRPRQSALSRSRQLEDAVLEKIRHLHRHSPDKLSRASGEFIAAKPPKGRPALERLHKILTTYCKRKQSSQQHALSPTLDFPISKPRASNARHDACPKSIDALPVSSKAPSAAKQSAVSLAASTTASEKDRPKQPRSKDASEPKGKKKAAISLSNSSPNLDLKDANSKRAESEDYLSSGWEPSVAEFDSALVNASAQLEAQSSRNFCGQSMEKQSFVFSSPVEKQFSFFGHPDSSRVPVAPSSAITQKSFTHKSATHIGGVSHLSTEKFENIWPKPLPGLLRAPLPVIWEVTRAALHCRVEIEDLRGLKYEPNWSEQASLRAALAAHPSFVGKQLPAASDSRAWSVSLDTFQSQSNGKAVQLYAELLPCAGGQQFNVRCHPLRLELAHRLARRFGADRFLEVILPSPTHDRPARAKPGLDPHQLVQWLSQGPHEFLGRTWVPFVNREVKPKKKKGAPTVHKTRILFFACDGPTFCSPRHPGFIAPYQEALTPMARTSMSLSGLLEWAVNIKNKKNANQSIMKLFSRLSLSLTKTVPTVVLSSSQIIIRDKDIGTHKVMNDGIGRMSRKLAHRISSRLGLTDCVSAFQARLGSAKGVWIIDANNENPEEEWIEIYPSQTKWQCDFEDPWHRTFEVGDWSKELKPASLSQQFIPVLEAQSANPDALRLSIRRHVEKELLMDLESQIRAMNDPQDFRLWLQLRPSNINDRTSEGCANYLGGLPDSNVDRVAFLLDSGFHPKKLKLMNELVYEQFISRTEILQNKMDVTIPCSTYAFMAADFSDTLEEGEVHLSFSTKFQVEGFSDTLLEGMDILVARSPAHFPSDIQRVRAVSRPELRPLKDVIIFSIKGQTPLADKLSGGDYDGDKAWICWDQDIVKDFRNAPVPKSVDLFKEGYLGKDTRKVSDLLDGRRLADHTAFDRACHLFIAESLFFNLQPKFLGICTKYKEKLCYQEDSVTSQASIRLSTLLSNLVDQSKQGILFSEDDWRRFREELVSKPLHSEDPAYATGARPRARGHNDRQHILDYLLFEVVRPLIEEACARFSKAIDEGNANHFDPDLVALRQMYENRPDANESGFTAIHKNLKAQIEQIKQFWAMSTRSRNGKEDETEDFAAMVKQASQRWLDIKIPPELQSLPFAREIMEYWGNEPIFHPWQLLKASVTFSDYKSQRFAWFMAGRQFGFMKAMRLSEGESVPMMVIPQLWGVLRPDKKMITRLSAQRGAAPASVESAMILEEEFDFDDDGTDLDDVF